MKRTLIEFYDPNFLENIVALFGAEYDRVIYLYLEESRIPDQKDRDRLTRFVRNRLGFEPEFRGVPASSAESLLRCFGEIAQTGGRFDFDITGGIPMFIAAAGLFAASCPEKPVFLIQFAPGQGKLVFCYPEGRPHEPSPTPVIDLTIPEVIQLSGASFLKDHGPARYELEKSGLRREIHEGNEFIIGERSENAVRHKQHAVAADQPHRSGIAVNQAEVFLAHERRQRLSLAGIGICGGIAEHGGLIGVPAEHVLAVELQKRPGAVQRDAAVAHGYKGHVPAADQYADQRGAALLGGKRKRGKGWAM